MIFEGFNQQNVDKHQKRGVFCEVRFNIEHKLHEFDRFKQFAELMECWRVGVTLQSSITPFLLFISITYYSILSFTFSLNFFTFCASKKG